MSVMDMNSRMAMAEKLSVQQLQQAVQSGSLPAYIGIPLIEQKTKEKSQMAAAQQGQQKPPSVAASILQQAEQQGQQEQGIDQLPSNLPIETGMAGGGIVAFADEGQVVDPYAAPTSIAPGMLPPAISPEGKASFDEYAKELKDLRGKGGSEREQAKAMALFQAGLGMMGGTSPNAFANIAAGAMPAVTQYQSALKDIRKEDRDALKQLLDLGLSKEKFLQEAQKINVDVYKADKAYDATMGAARLAASSRTAGEKGPTSASIATEYINGKTQEYIKGGMDPAIAKNRATEEYYAQSRPMQPSAVVETGLTARLKEDEILKGLTVDRYRTRDPKALEDIDTAIKKRQAEIRAEFSGGTSQGRGMGGTGGGGGGGGRGNTNDPFGLFN